MSMAARAEALKSEHDQLEAQLDQESHRPHPDDAVVADLKKRKLAIKDELARING